MISKAVFWAIDAIIKRSIAITFVILSVYLLSKKNSKICERYSDTPWNTKSVFKLLFLFLIVEYSLPFFLGFIFYNDLMAFISKEAVWRDSLAGLLSYLILLAVIWYYVTLKYKESFVVLGFQKNKMKSGLIWGLYVLLFIEVIFILIKYLRIAYNPSGGNNEDFLRYLRIIAIGPVAEEIFFRGYMYPCFRRKTGIIWAMLFSTVCFMAYHKTEMLWLSAFINGIILCFIYEKSGSLLAPILGHIFINTFVCIKKYYFGALIYLIPWYLIWIVVIATVIFCYIIRINILSEKGKRCQVQRGHISTS